MRVVPLYAGLLALMFVYLSIRTIGYRRRFKVGLGDASKPEMLRAIRVHANFAEYVPLGLLMIFLVEFTGAAAWLAHALSLSLLVGRVSHAYGVSQIQENFRFRMVGMILTFASLISSSLYLLVWFARN